MTSTRSQVFTLRWNGGPTQSHTFVSSFAGQAGSVSTEVSLELLIQNDSKDYSRLTTVTVNGLGLSLDMKGDSTRFIREDAQLPSVEWSLSVADTFGAELPAGTAVAVNASVVETLTLAAATPEPAAPQEAPTGDYEMMA